MNVANLPLFSLISQRLGWLTERHKVLAENVANVDTPNYKARDLKPVDFSRFVGRTGNLGPAVTDLRHINVRGGDAGKVATVKSSNVETTLSGNNVSIESELLKVTDTATNYQLITNLYRKQIGLLKTVIGRSQS